MFNLLLTTELRSKYSLEVREESKRKVVFDREKVLAHANEVLMSGLKSIELAKIMNTSVNQFYDYRSRSKKIEKIRLGTLIKLEKAYVYMLDEQKRTIGRKRGALQ